jgi:hypothetical protein
MGWYLKGGSMKNLSKMFLVLVSAMALSACGSGGGGGFSGVVSDNTGGTGSKASLTLFNNYPELPGTVGPKITYWSLSKTTSFNKNMMTGSIGAGYSRTFTNIEPGKYYMRIGVLSTYLGPDVPQNTTYHVFQITLSAGTSTFTLPQTSTNRSVSPEILGNYSGMEGPNEKEGPDQVKE